MRILAIDEVARTEAQRELVIVESRLQELTDRIAAVEDRLTRTEIRAPLAGRINELSVFTVGGVITPAEVLATIVPDSAELSIEVQLPITAIDQVTIGQAARVRFSAFNHRTTPELQATVTYISPATTVGSPDAQPYYVANVALLADELARLEGLELVPGMPVEVYLATREQTALAYFARPLIDQYERALRRRVRRQSASAPAGQDRRRRDIRLPQVLLSLLERSPCGIVAVIGSYSVQFMRSAFASRKRIPLMLGTLSRFLLLTATLGLVSACDLPEEPAVEAPVAAVPVKTPAPTAPAPAPVKKKKPIVIDFDDNGSGGGGWG